MEKASEVAALAEPSLADAAPGVKEILGIGKLCHEVRERHYDLVIVDAEASGHIVAQIDAPRAISELVHVENSLVAQIRSLESAGQSVQAVLQNSSGRRKLRSAA